MTNNEARMLVSGDTVEWIEGANGCSAVVGKVRFDAKNYSHYVDWPDGQRTWMHDGPALKCMRVVSKAKTVNGFPR